MIGVHTPETAWERDSANVAREVKKLGITYPVLLDTGGENWRRWSQHYWPAVYLLDRQNRIRARWEGELEWQGAGGEAKLARRIEALLKER